jgi:AcrR family transcriptional regulator
MVRPSPAEAVRPLAPSAAEQTRAALVQAGLKLFGRQGFDGTSTREIARLAKANIGSIAYHFGGKEGLHEACADFTVETIRKVTEPALPTDRPATVADAEARLAQALDQAVAFFVASPEAGDIAQFVMRQLAQPGAALDRIYAGVFEPTHRQLCVLWEQATGEPAESERTKLTAFTLIGQIVYFRIGREAVMRRMGWSDIGGAQASAIADVAKNNLTALLTAGKAVTP